MLTRKRLLVDSKICDRMDHKKNLSEGSSSFDLVDGVKTSVRVESTYSEEFEIEVDVRERSVLSPLMFAIVADDITEKAKRGVVKELLYADDLVVMSETIEDVKERLGN